MGIFRKLEKAMFGIDRDLEKRGLPGTAMVVGVTETKETWDDSSVYEYTLNVTLPGREPYRAVHRQDGRAIESTELSVKVDPQDPQKLLIDWDASRAGLNARQMAGVDLTPTGGSPREVWDRQLRNGYITQEQYDSFVKNRPDLA